MKDIDYHWNLITESSVSTKVGILPSNISKPWDSNLITWLTHLSKRVLILISLLLIMCYQTAVINFYRRILIRAEVATLYVWTIKCIDTTMEKNITDSQAWTYRHWFAHVTTDYLPPVGHPSTCRCPLESDDSEVFCSYQAFSMSMFYFCGSHEPFFIA